MKLRHFVCLNLILFSWVAIMFVAWSAQAKGKLSAKAVAQRRLDAVNQHMMKTNKKIELGKKKIEIDSYYSAPELDKTASFVNRSDYSSYGVNMKTESPIEDPAQRPSYKSRSSDAFIEQQIYQDQNN